MSRENRYAALGLTVGLLSAMVGAIALSYLIAVSHHEPVRQQPSISKIIQGPGRVEPAKQKPTNEKPLQLFGYVPNRQVTQRFLASLPRPTIREAGPELFRVRGPPKTTATEPVLLYRAYYVAWDRTFHKPWVAGIQEIGDCTSFGSSNAVNIHLATMFLAGDLPSWLPADESSIYGGARCEAMGTSNAGTEDGATGAGVAKWLKEWGVVFKQDYKFVDCTTYSAQRAKEWGQYGCGGREDRGRLDEIAKLNPIKGVALVETWDELCLAVENGYPTYICSGQGFKVPVELFGYLEARRPVPVGAMANRDADGFLHPSGTWYHCMAVIGIRYDKPAALILNSWPLSWIAGAKFPSDMPDGSFWTDRPTVEKMLREFRDSFVISGYVDFPARKLDYASWAHNSRTEAIYAMAP